MHILQKMHALNARRPSASAAFSANATEYNGTDAYQSKSSTVYGSSSPVGSIVVWTRLDGSVGSGAQYPLFGGMNPGQFSFGYLYQEGVGFFLAAQDTAVADPAVFAQATDPGLPTGWLCNMVSWDFNAGPGSRSVQMYRGDTSVFSGFLSDVGSAFSLPCSSMSNWVVGGDGSQFFNGGMAELWVDFTTKIDFSNVTNRRKFFSAAGKPVDLGADGSIPLGTAPAIYLKNPAATVEVNIGTGGNFTRNGTLTAAATSPSD